MIGQHLNLNIDSSHLLVDVEVEDRFDLIRKISESLKDDPSIRDADQVAEAAISREEEMSTGIDGGIALPHARTASAEKLVLAFIRPSKPVDFMSPDNQPADLIFFSAIPERCIDEYLKLIAKLVRWLQVPGICDSLRSAKSVEELKKIFETFTAHNGR